MRLHHRGALLACVLLTGAAPLATVLTPAPAHAMSAVDRRLLVAVVGFAFDEEAAKDAMESGADINSRNDAMDNDTLLIAAVRQFKDAEVIKWLLENGADPALKNDHGRTALSYARESRIGNTPAGRAVLALLQPAPAGPTPTVVAQAPAAAPVEAPAETDGGDPDDGGAADVQEQAADAEDEATETAVQGGGEAFFQAPILPGVYECYGQSAMYDPMSFGILDGSNYMSSMGRRGRYSYDARTGVLLLDPGPDPARFRRYDVNNFRAINADGSWTAFVCPLNTAKDPARPPW